MKQLPSETECAKKKSWIWNNWERVFPYSFEKVDFEHDIYGELTQPEFNTHPWRIDYLAKHKGKMYIVEEDLSGGNIWHPFKVFAYRAAYCIDRVTSIKKIGCMIFFNDKIFSHRLRNICAVAGTEYCTFEKQGDIFVLRKTSLWKTKRSV